MKEKISMRYLVKLFNLEKIPTKKIFENTTLPEEILGVLTEKYKTLGEFTEVENNQLLSIAGIGEARLKEIKSDVQLFFSKIIELDFITGMPVNKTPAQRLGYGCLIVECELYGISIKKIDKAIKKLSKKKRRFIKLYYGVDGCVKVRSMKKISTEMDISVSKLESLKFKSLTDLKKLLK